MPITTTLTTRTQQSKLTLAAVGLGVEARGPRDVVVSGTVVVPTHQA